MSHCGFGGRGFGGIWIIIIIILLFFFEGDDTTL
ncbi:hypothetical protein SPSIL_027260 [Sporomusa silvacetica DSM 10669]|uniref:Sporulation protein YjcZ n=1 Tax=Sporomusa silvacetica DSM 10669 TaxID=1123289 RepID=A0ABZ3IMA5_9FIRM|nr:hypothetical protein SPSIL_38980 [Sporomusa silvacetica DSM 10669]